ncbi:MAG: glycosyl transferase [Bacilli bacterium]|jgi:cellobiose phosphorylase|nr:glycosyl transferase [Bacilli bacterium]
MKFGHFDDRNREYVIETPHTPLPWINYLGTDDFHSLISNTCGGYSFYKDAKLRRITRYRYNNVPRDVSGRFYYINDKGTIWNIGYLPTKTDLDSYECRHGLSYTSFHSSKNGLDAKLTCFVPLKDNCEVNLVSLTNTSAKSKTFTFYAAVEFCLYNAVDDANNYQRNLNLAEVEIDDHTVYHKTEYRERRNHYAFFYGSVAHDGFDTDRNVFLGLENGWDAPEAVTKGISFNSVVHDYYPMACHRYDITLKPGETKNLIFVLGYVENNPDEKWEAKNVINKTKAQAMQKRYSTLAGVTAALKDLKDYWDALLDKFVVKTGDEKFDRMANIWNQYQCMVTYMMSRSASYYETGTGRGMGFRDSCQDLLGFVHLIPDKAKERIIDIASIQFEDGSTYHQYQPLDKKGNADIGSGFNDDPLWLVGATIAYIRETGDASILDIPTPFNNVKGSEKPLYDHLMISLKHTINNKGPHGLPLIGRADWNDCLNLNCFSTKDGESFQTVENNDTHVAESVFIAGMFVLYGTEFVELANYIGKKKDAKLIDQEVKAIEAATVKSGFDYDGGYFIRAYDAYSHEVGSSKCEEGKIFIEPQGFCTLAGIGKDKDLGKKAIDASFKYLLDDWGCELLYPPYSTYHVELGEISSYPQGVKENGAVFNHNNPWLTMACCVEKEPERAFQLYRLNAPAYIEDKSDIHKTEPYVYSQMIAGRFSKSYGQAKNSWLTGSATWSFVALSEGIMGIRPQLTGLEIDPCLPKEMTDVTMERTFRGCHFHIHVSNKPGNKATIIVNGKEQASKIVTLVKGIKDYDVSVTMA